MDEQDQIFLFLRYFVHLEFFCGFGVFVGLAVQSMLVLAVPRFALHIWSKFILK